MPQWLYYNPHGLYAINQIIIVDKPSLVRTLTPPPRNDNLSSHASKLRSNHVRAPLRIHHVVPPFTIHWPRTGTDSGGMEGAKDQKVKLVKRRRLPKGVANVSNVSNVFSMSVGSWRRAHRHYTFRYRANVRVITLIEHFVLSAELLSRGLIVRSASFRSIALQRKKRMKLFLLHWMPRQKGM